MALFSANDIKINSEEVTEHILCSVAPSYVGQGDLNLDDR